MKKLVLSFLIVTIAFAAHPVKANTYDKKTIASATLVTMGIASGLIAYKLNKDYQKERSKLNRILQDVSAPLNSNYDQRVETNRLRLWGRKALSFISFCTSAVGLALSAHKIFCK